MLTSTHAFTDRKTAHANVIDAAAEAGVRHLVYMPIYRKAGSTFTMKEITEEDIFSIESCGHRAGLYTRTSPAVHGACHSVSGPNAVETGVRVPAGNGKFAAATRDDLAAAHADDPGRAGARRQNLLSIGRTGRFVVRHCQDPVGISRQRCALTSRSRMRNTRVNGSTRPSRFRRPVHPEVGSGHGRRVSGRRQRRSRNAHRPQAHDSHRVFTYSTPRCGRSTEGSAS